MSTSPRGWVARLRPYLLAHRRDLALSLTGSVLAAGGAVVTPLLVRAIVDRAGPTAGGRPAAVGWLLIGLAASGLVRFGAAYLRRWYGGRLALSVQHDLRTDIFGHLQRLDLATHEQMTTGQLLTRATSDVTLVHGVLAMAPLTLGSVLIVVSSTIAMVALSPLLALVTVATVPAVVVAALRIRRTLFPATWDAQQRAAAVAAVVDEAVEGVRVVKGFGQESRELDRLTGTAEELYAGRLRAARIQARFEAGLSAVPSVAQVGILAVGGVLAARGRITLGTLLAFTTYLAQLSAPTRFASSALAMATQARAGIARIGELLDATPGVAERPGAKALPEGPVGIELRGVRFGYEGAPPVLDGLDLEVRAGETLALVGASGSGKSTVAALVSRLYDPDQGEVVLAGVDARDLALGSVRGRVGMVFEQPFLFSGTVHDNVAYGRPEATAAEVEAATRAAAAHEFVTELADGYGTVLGERGVTLSGGQRQRLALARALVTDPAVLVLDDATSAVDAGVEAEIHANLRVLLERRTTLLIAHRRSTLRLADRLAVLAGGKIVDCGTHAELWARCAHYRDLLTGAEGATPLATATPPPANAGSRPPAGTNGAPAGSVSPPGAGHLPRPGRGHHGLNHTTLLAALAPAEELLEAVDRLAPASERPGIDPAVLADAGRGFSLARILRPHRRALVVAVGLVMAHGAASLSGPALVRRGVDVGVTSGEEPVVLATAAVLGLVVLADWWVTSLGGLATSRVAERVLFGLRVRVFAHLQRLGIDFYERETAGSIMTRMTSDMESLSSLLEEGMVGAVSNLVVCAGVGVAMFAMSPELATAALSVSIPLALATSWFRRRSDRAYLEARERVAEVNARLAEGIAGVRVAQAFAQEQRTIGRFVSVAEQFLGARLRAQRLIALYFPFVELLSVLASVLVFGIGTRLVASGELTIGELIAFSLYLTLFFAPVQQLSQVVDAYQQARAALGQMTALLALEPSVADRPDAVDAGRLRGDVALRGVRYRYPGARADALAGIDLSIAPGETVALVGATGAGKSTVLKLLARFTDPSDGTVEADGRPLVDLKLESYRRNLGYVPQEPFVHATTVREAIAYGRPDATDAEVEAAARAVGAHEVVLALPGGYGHVLGERGRSLAAGQRQLLALARARLADPAILLLDEATANLDLASEARVSRAMTEVAAARTTVVVAHRLDTARRADRIVVLAAGRIVEEGTHDDLVAAGGTYARMWASFALDATAVDGAGEAGVGKAADGAAARAQRAG